MIQGKHILGSVKGFTTGLLRPNKTAVAVLVFVIYSVAAFGFLHGASLAYTADSVEDTQMVRSDMPVYTASDFEDVEPSPVEQRINGLVGAEVYGSVSNTWIEDSLNSQLARMMNNMVALVVVVSNAAGVFFYHNQWIPEQAVSLFVQATQFAMIGMIGIVQLKRIYEIRGGR